MVWHVTAANQVHLFTMSEGQVEGNDMGKDEPEDKGCTQRQIDLSGMQSWTEAKQQQAWNLL